MLAINDILSNFVLQAVHLFVHTFGLYFNVVTSFFGYLANWDEVVEHITYLFPVFGENTNVQLLQLIIVLVCYFVSIGKVFKYLIPAIWCTFVNFPYLIIVDGVLFVVFCFVILGINVSNRFTVFKYATKIERDGKNLCLYVSPNFK